MTHGICEEASVKEASQVQYCQILQTFLTHFCLRTLRINEGDLDAKLVQWVDYMLLEGRDPSGGQKLLAAILYWYPIHNSGPRPRLLRFIRALKGWRKRMPQTTRLPMPFFLVAAIALSLIRAG